MTEIIIAEDRLQRLETYANEEENGEMIEVITAYRTLINTIESQNSQIESLKAITELKNVEIAELRDREFNHYPIAILELETRIFNLQDAANTQESITELAMKCLNESHIALKWAVEYHIKTCTCAECNALGVVEFTLSEISKLNTAAVLTD